MKSKQTRSLQAFRRVQAWFAQHPEVLANSGSSQQALASQLDALKQVVDSMTAGATEQTTQKGQATLAAKDEQQLRADVRSLHMKAIVTVAGALRGKVPGMGVFKLPSREMRSENLVHAAEAVRTTASVYKDVFVEHGLPADFLDQLDAATSALEQSVDARGVARSRIAGASSSLANEQELGRQIVTMIDASLTHALKSDPATLASWRQAKRVTVKGVTSREVLPETPVAGTAASSAPAVVSSPPAAVPTANSAAPSDSSAVTATTLDEQKAA
jgi:hypothetical protein